MGVPVAVLAEVEFVGGAAVGGRGGAAVVADLGAEVLAGEEVGGVDVAVAEEAELGGVAPAVEDGGPVGAEVAGHDGPLAGRRPRTGARHFPAFPRADTGRERERERGLPTTTRGVSTRSEGERKEEEREKR